MNKLLKYFLMYAYILISVLYFINLEYSALGIITASFNILMIFVVYKEWE